MNFFNAMPSEATPLLTDSEPTTSRSRPSQQPTALPWGQLVLALLANACNALGVLSIPPYINQLIAELDIVGGDKRKVGYYVGVVFSAYSTASTISVLFWSRLSDSIGRKPVMLIGLGGLIISRLWFGVSRTLEGLLASQCLGGITNGNTAVVKSVVGEITDSTNRAYGFAIYLMAWSMSGSIASLIGGSFAKPHDRFPDVFGGEFWILYPYFLPCLIAAILSTLSSLVILYYFKEPLHKPLDPLAPHHRPIPLRDLLTFPVVIAISNTAALDSVFESQAALLPLVFSMPINLGGVGLEPSQIGYILGAYRITIAFFQATLSPKLIHYLGEQRTFRLSIYSTFLLWFIIPATNLFARRNGLSASVWICVVLLAVPITMIDIGYTCLSMYTTAAAPSKRSLGSVNGLSKTAVMLTRSISPVITTSLFSFSLQHNLFGGYAVYIALGLWSCAIVPLALRLPRNARPPWEGESNDD